MTRKEEFVKEMKVAIKDNKYLYIILSTGDIEELIFNRPCDIPKMIELYDFRYDDNLVSISNPNVKITEFAARCRDCLVSIVKKY